MNISKAEAVSRFGSESREGHGTSEPWPGTSQATWLSRILENLLMHSVAWCSVLDEPLPWRINSHTQLQKPRGTIRNSWCCQDETQILCNPQQEISSSQVIPKIFWAPHVVMQKKTQHFLVYHRVNFPRLVLRFPQWTKVGLLQLPHATFSALAQLENQWDGSVSPHDGASCHVTRLSQ